MSYIVLYQYIKISYRKLILYGCEYVHFFPTVLIELFFFSLTLSWSMIFFIKELTICKEDTQYYYRDVDYYLFTVLFSQ